MRIALYQPDIAQNTGTLLRLGACLDVGVDIIEPAGFALSDRALKRAGLDYAPLAHFTRHISFDAFYATVRAERARIILLSTKARVSYLDHTFEPSDVLLLGRESAGVPQAVHDTVDAAVRIPLKAHRRSLNVAVAAAIVLGEALRQTGGFASVS